VPDELDGANITQDTARLAIKGANSVFMRECLRTTAFQHWMAKHTKGVAVRGINLGDVKQMPMITPSENEQLEFANRAEAIAEVLRQQCESLKIGDDLFSSAQQSAFGGMM
jgi:type I restriction enzyme S subunit